MSAGYLEEMRVGFRDAIDRGLERREVTLEVDGETIHLVFAGDTLAEALLPALSPLLSESGAPPVMTVELWDSASADLAPPPAPWRPDDGGPSGAVRGYNDDSMRTVVDPLTGTLVIADMDEGQAVVWARSAQGLPGWWRAVPLRMVLEWALARPGHHFAHAGAVGVDGRGVLLAGSGRAGKSTTATLCMEAGMDFVSDDYLLLSAGPPAVAHALFATARIDNRSLANMPELARVAGDPAPGEEKVLLDLQALRPERLARSLTVEAVLLPSFGGGSATSLHPVGAGAAVRALAPSTIFQTPGGGAPALRVVADVLRSVPAYELRMGRDIKDVPGRIGSLLEEDA